MTKLPRKTKIVHIWVRLLKPVGTDKDKLSTLLIHIRALIESKAAKSGSVNAAIYDPGQPDRVLVTFNLCPEWTVACGGRSRAYKALLQNLREKMPKTYPLLDKDNSP